MIAAALLLQLASTTPDPIDTALGSLPAAVEEDGKADAMLRSLTTTGCTTRVEADGRNWTIDWTQAEGVALEDTFVFVATKSFRIAIVVGLKTEADLPALRAFAAAMRDRATACRVSK